MEVHLEVAGLLGLRCTCVSVNAFESVLCGKGISVGFFDFGRSSNFTVVTAFLGRLGHVCTPPLCV